MNLIIGSKLALLCGLLCLAIPEAASSAQLETSQAVISSQPMTEWSSVTNGWRLKVKRLKPAAIPYERIYFELVLTNIGSQTLPAPFLGREHHNISYELRDSTGKKMCQVMIDGFGRSDPKRLKPGDSICEYLDLNVLFCSAGPAGRAMLAPGRYSLRVSLYLDPLFKAPRAENTLVLGPIDIFITPPIGKNAEAVVLYEAGIIAFETDRNKARECLYKILNDYSQTPLDEVANHALMFYVEQASLSGQNEVLRLQKRFFLEHSDSPYNIANLTNMISLVSDEEMKSLCNAIKGKPGASVTLGYIKQTCPKYLEEETKR